MQRGYLKLWRKLIDWEWFQDSNTLHLFIYLLIKANYKDGRYMNHDIKKGQVVFGRRSASETTGLTEREIRTSLSRLKSTNEATSKTTSKFSIITLCNFDTYNNELEGNDQQATSKNPEKRPAKQQPELELYNDVNVGGDQQNDQQKSGKTTTPKKYNNTSNTYTHPKTTTTTTKTTPEWKKHCETFVQYQLWESKEYHKIINNLQWISERREFHTPRYNRQLNITETIRKAHVDYWSKPVGWKKIKSRRGQTIDWESTWNNALSMRCNEVWEDVTPENIQQPKIPAIHRTPEVEI